MRFAILGAGRIGQVHADAVAGVAGAELVAIADTLATAAQAVQARHGCDVRTIDQIVAAGDADAVLICTLTDTHADLIDKLACTGRSVFCAKPIELEIDRVRACPDVVRDTGAFLMIGFQRRFEPDFNVMRAAIDAGQIGKVEMVMLTSRDPSPPQVNYLKRAGGIFRDMTIQDIDVACWMLDEEVATVLAAEPAFLHHSLQSGLSAGDRGVCGECRTVNVAEIMG